MTKRGGRLHAVLRDVVAMANTNGGTVYIGVKADPKALPVGVSEPEEAINTLKTEIQRKVQPPLDVDLTVVETHGRQVLQLTVPAGEDVPYAIDGTSIYLRQETETNLAVRDEIVSLVTQALPAQAPESDDEPAKAEQKPDGVEPPGTGVQIVDTVERKGTKYHAMKDLRNGNVVHNVTRSSARKLWRYAITEHETHPVKESKVQWSPENERLGVWKSSKRAGKVRYDLVQRMPGGDLHVYYGVTEDGIDGPWRVFLEE
jgi:hypothetical protein